MPNNFFEIKITGPFDRYEIEFRADEYFDGYDNEEEIKKAENTFNEKFYKNAMVLMKKLNDNDSSHYDFKDNYERRTLTIFMKKEFRKK